MTITVVIRCLNEERHLPTLLTALRNQTRRPDEVLVVDSGSRDATIEIARKGGARVVTIAPSEFSFGRSLNLGASHAAGDVLVLASAHTYPEETTWLERLVAPFQDAAVALSYGRQRGDHRSKFSEQRIFRQWFPDESCTDQGHAFCNNANAAVRKAVWSTMPYDDDIPGLEDIHWAKRARQRGFRIAYVAEAAIVHVHEESYRSIYNRYRREAIGLQAINPGEHMSLVQAATLLRRAIHADLRAATAEGIGGRVWPSILAFRSAQYWGTYRGLRWRKRLTDEVRRRLYYPPEYPSARTAASSAGGGKSPVLAPARDLDRSA